LIKKSPPAKSRYAMP